MEFIKKLAAYENMSEQVVATVEVIESSLFERKGAEVLIAEFDEKPAGFVLFFQNFSTFLGKTGIYIEDLFVEEHMRNLGMGKQLFQAVAQIAVERGCERLEWSCLDWNQPSIDFYHHMGAAEMGGWTTFRLSGDQIRAALFK